ncbi:DUF4465 domain-containing protein [Saccharicrinis carchari]|nr:DUF4465 domain-containing protein [Saccharicrinis carchari]
MSKYLIYLTTCLLTLVLVSSCENKIKDIPPSEIYINMPLGVYEVKVNDTITLSPKITYDINSTYTWMLNNELVSEEKDLRLIPKSLQYLEYTFSVKNARGAVDTLIPVQSMYLIDFDEKELATDSFWVNTNNISSFVSDKIRFEVNGNSTSENWTGFTYSNLIGNKSSEDMEKFSAYKKPLERTTSIFGVIMLDAYGGSISLETADGEDHLFKSISVNNTYYVYDAIQNGKHGSKRFGGTMGTEKDWLKLTITGFNKNGTQRGSVDIMLADYTTGSNRNNSILGEWTTFNLQSIGKVSRMEFVMTSSDRDPDKINTPPFVCIDEIKIIE